jgi:hypothetical protein
VWLRFIVAGFVGRRRHRNFYYCQNRTGKKRGLAIELSRGTIASPQSHEEKPSCYLEV